jgi:hypothetical protein
MTKQLSYDDIADRNFTGGLSPSEYLDQLWPGDRCPEDESVNRLTSEDPDEDDDESPGTCDEMSQWDLDGDEVDEDDDE